MRMTCAIVALCVAGDLLGATIGTQITSLGGNSYRETFLISGFTFHVDDTLDLTFDHNLFGTLSNPVGLPSSDWIVALDQPNLPTPGLNGDYFLTALVNNPSLVGPFSVDFTFVGTGFPSVTQPFTIFDPNFTPLESGDAINSLPEPSSLSLMVVGLLAAAVVCRARLAAWRRQ